MKSAASLTLKLDTSRARGKQLLTHRNGGFTKADTDMSAVLPHKAGIENICVVPEFEHKTRRQSLLARELKLRAVFSERLEMNPRGGLVWRNQRLAERDLVSNAMG
jgi:hypothetical protein